MVFDSQWLKTQVIMQGCAVWGPSMAENIFGFTFSQKSSKIAIHRHVQASANGFNMNNVIED